MIRLNLLSSLHECTYQRMTANAKSMSFYLTSDTYKLHISVPERTECCMHIRMNEDTLWYPLTLSDLCDVLALVDGSFLTPVGAVVKKRVVINQGIRYQGIRYQGIFAKKAMVHSNQHLWHYFFFRPPRNRHWSQLLQYSHQIIANTIDCHRNAMRT